MNELQFPRFSVTSVRNVGMWVNSQSFMIIFMVHTGLPRWGIWICGLGHKLWCQSVRFGSCSPRWGMWMCGLSHEVSNQSEWFSLCSSRWGMWMCGLSHKVSNQSEWCGLCLPRWGMCVVGVWVNSQKFHVTLYGSHLSCLDFCGSWRLNFCSQSGVWVWLLEFWQSRLCREILFTLLVVS